MLKKENRLKKKVDFDAAYKKGRVFTEKPISIKTIRNGLDVSRVGVAVGKNFSKKAVERNRVKRILRSVLSNSIHRIKTGFDIIILISRKAKPGDIDTKIVESAVEKMLAKSKLLK